MWIKICGLTDPHEAREISEMGVDAIGLVFYDRSPRSLTIEQASNVAFQIRSPVLKVGVFVDSDWVFVRRAVASVPLDILQWHGGPLSEEDLSDIAALGIPWIDVFRMESSSLENPPPRGASMQLVEGFSEKAPGGTHTKWDFRKLAGMKFPVPLILSGGLDPETVKQAIVDVSPFGVDVSSGVEKSPGRKDLEKVYRFVAEARKG